MKRTQLLYGIIAMALGVAPLAGFASWFGKTDTKGTEASPDKLGGAMEKRFIPYLSTDKQIYRTGENVYFRCIVLKADNNIPAKIDTASIKFTIKDGMGSVVKEDGRMRYSSGYSWRIPDDLKGGEYTAIMEIRGLAPVERKFEVRAYQPPRIQSQIVFLRDGYHPGEKVEAAVHFKRAEGGVPENAKVRAMAMLDGKNIFDKNDLKLDNKGNLNVSFELPAKTETDNATLAFTIQDGGTVETCTKTIPILLENYEISFYPEGGTPVAGLPCRVYIQAKNKNGKPADISGTIQPGGEMVKTVHEGRGFFTYTPDGKSKYELVMPSGKKFDLPQAIPEGAVIHALKDTFKESIELEVQSTEKSRAARVVLRKREMEVGRADIKAGVKSTVKIAPTDYEGVLTATVETEEGLPIAERLVFREPKFKVNIDVKATSKAFVPGGEVTLEVTATDGNNSPADAIVCIGVTDESVLEMKEKREQSPLLPVMVYLENEVRDLADAHVYFDAENPFAARNIDLLLGTQGWRRFAVAKYDEFKKQYPDQAKRLFGSCLQEPPVKYARRNAPGRGLGGLIVVEDRMENVECQALPVAKMAVGPRVNNAVAVPDVLEENVEEADMVFPEEVEPIAIADVKRKERIRIPPQYFVIVREYAFRARKDRRPNERIDFTETIYWNAALHTDPRTGKVTAKFSLPDSVTTFRISADCVDNRGGLGSQVKTFSSVEPFFLEPKMPAELTAGDIAEIPVTLVNSTAEDLNGANLAVKCEGLELICVSSVPAIKAGERVRATIRVKAPKAGNASLNIQAAANGYTDNVTRKVAVHPRLFPFELNVGGMISDGKSFSTTLNIPENVEPGSFATSVKIYPSPLASMQEALNALLRSPYGCFEQTSSTNYPVVMVQQYYRSHQGIDPENIRKAQKLMEEGYKRLLSFESRDKGYEWFGENPGHEALTAYGLMEFTEMSQLMTIDPKMLERTRGWLLARRDGKGGFLRNSKSLDSFGRAPENTTNAYILWALLESGENPKTLEKEIAAVKAMAEKSKDSYIHALTANILAIAQDNAGAVTFARRLAAAVDKKEGFVGGSESTITCSGGEARKIETTSLAILAWLKTGDEFAPQVENSMRFLAALCKSGRFGSTQSTILALKAINAYDKARSIPGADGTLTLLVDGKPFGKTLEFKADSKDCLELPDFSAAMTAGKHTLEVKMSGGKKMPVSLSCSGNIPKPSSDPDCALSLEIKTSNAKLTEGDISEMSVTVKNLTGKPVAMPVAVIGIPSGLELRYDALKEMVKSGRIAAYEMFHGELVLYWRALREQESVTLPLAVTARVPGEYKATAARAYLYYTDEAKTYTDGVSVQIGTIKN